MENQFIIHTKQGHLVLQKINEFVLKVKLVHLSWQVGLWFFENYSFNITKK